MIRQTIALMLMLVSTASFSQELSQYSAVRVQKAHQLAQDEKLKQAISELKQIDTSRAYDQAFVARMLGVYLWQDDQPQAAIKQLNQAVSSGLLQDEQAWITERMLADLYLNQQNFEQAIKHYYQLIKTAPQTQSADDLWLRIAQAHYQIEQWSKVIPATDRYLKLVNKEPLQPLSLKLGAQLQLKQWSKAIPTLKQLIALQPDKVNWWRQLAGLQIRVGRDKDALDTLSLAKINKLDLTQNDRRMLAQLYAKRGVPERAALEISQLDGAESNVQLLSEQAIYWQSAKEWDKAIEIWQRTAQLDKKYRWNLAQLLVQQGEYSSALPVLNKVEGRGEQVALAKTRVLFKLNRIEEALIEAKRADQINSSGQAQSWIRYLTQIRKMDDTSSG
ncbi:tetratricopeptide repeat protein [Vibrio brasiliensis]|uniref:tetratricopeptide repeat protein n=1 Tax=Vibrio brasiliensis TaxID=170652 RepID=UPI001EFC5629|nr:tetratricopeptide repeat protein [Vibrio brasiliensis]MCG9750825.1 tetratricopeptide repeat protein [Vibrio brasiliensis]